MFGSVPFWHSHQPVRAYTPPINSSSASDKIFGALLKSSLDTEKPAFLAIAMGSAPVVLSSFFKSASSATLAKKALSSSSVIILDFS